MPENNQEIKPMDAADFRLWRTLDFTRHVISRYRDLELARFGTTREQLRILDILKANNGSTSIKEIADRTFRQHHTVSTLICRMEARGLVIKNKDSSDGRQYIISITEEGDSLHERVPTDSLKDVFSQLSKGEKNDLESHLWKLLKYVVAVLEKEMEQGKLPQD